MDLKARVYIRDVIFLVLGYIAACFIFYAILLILAPGSLSDGRSGTVYLMFAALIGIFLMSLLPRRFEKSIWGAVIKPTDRYSLPKRLLISLGCWLVISLLSSRMQDFVTALLLERRYGSFPNLYPDFYSPEYRQLYQTAGAYAASACVALLFPAFIISQGRQTLKLHREQNNGGRSVGEGERV